jgi:hypothetical protein
MAAVAGVWCGAVVQSLMAAVASVCVVLWCRYRCMCSVPPFSFAFILQLPPQRYVH